MKNLRKLHLDAYYDAHYEEYKHSAFYKIDEDKAASKSAEITEQIAIEFANFYASYCNKHGQTHSEEVFQEFLKTMQ